MGFRLGQGSRIVVSTAEPLPSGLAPQANGTGAMQSPSGMQATLSAAMRQQLDTCLGQQEQAPVHVPSDDPQNTDPTPADHLRSAQHEEKDDAFSDANTEALEQDLAEASRRFDFRFERVDCRSSRCLVRLDWPSLGDAKSAIKGGLSAAFTRSHCHHRMVLPEGADERARAATTLIATCEPSRGAKAAMAHAPP